MTTNLKTISDYLNKLILREKLLLLLVVIAVGEEIDGAELLEIVHQK